MERQKYTYKGAVYCYNDIVSHNWSGQAVALSEKQAASNLAFQFKKLMGYIPSTPVRLAGKPKLTS